MEKPGENHEGLSGEKLEFQEATKVQTRTRGRGTLPVVQSPGGSKHHGHEGRADDPGAKTR